MKKIISVVTSCFNENENIRPFYERTKAEIEKHPEYDYEFIVADNMSSDGTRDILREIAGKDPRFRVIFNARNFGHIRSPYNALLKAKGDLIFFTCSDLQEPPEMLTPFLEKYEEGYLVVAGVRSGTQANFFMEILRGAYYKLLSWAAPEEKLLQKFTGFGLYDKKFIDALKLFHEPYPYFRGLVSEIGLKQTSVPFIQAKRTHGKTKNNWCTLYDMAMTGIVNHTKLPLRLAVLCGAVIAVISILIGLGYLIAKLVWWNNFNLGLAPMVVGMFFLSAVQLIFIGIIGEYLGAIWTQVKNRPLVIEEETLNFPEKDEK